MPGKPFSNKRHLIFPNKRLGKKKLCNEWVCKILLLFFIEIIITYESESNLSGTLLN